MITICPQCKLSLAVTAADLRVAQGQVRCGRCTAVFNALLSLQEGPRYSDSDPVEPIPEEFRPQVDALRRAAAAPPVSAPPAPEPLPPEPLRAEPPHQEPQHAEAPPPEPAAPEPPAPEPLYEEPLAASPAAAGAPGPAVPEPAPPEPTVPEGPVPEPIAPAPRIEDWRPDEGEWRISPALLDAVRERELTPAPGPSPGPAPTPIASAEPAPAAPAFTAPEWNPPAAAPSPMRAAAAPDPASAFQPAARTAGPSRLLLGTAALALLLCLQVAVHFRSSLAGVPLLGAITGGIARAFGLETAGGWDLRAYELRQQGVISEPGNAGTLTLRASIRNGGTQPQPAPLLRLTLLDRFGNRVATRDLRPGEYADSATAVRGGAMLQPGQRVDAEVAVVDPGGGTVGFELDACLSRADGSTICAGELSPAPAS